MLSSLATDPVDCDKKRAPGASPATKTRTSRSCRDAQPATPQDSRLVGVRVVPDRIGALGRLERECAGLAASVRASSFHGAYPRRRASAFRMAGPAANLTSPGEAGLRGSCNAGKILAGLDAGNLEHSAFKTLPPALNGESKFHLHRRDGHGFALSQRLANFISGTL